MIELWKTLKTAEAQADAIYTAAEQSFTAAVAARAKDETAPAPIPPSQVIDALPVIRHALGRVEASLNNAALAKAKADLAATLKAAAPTTS